MPELDKSKIEVYQVLLDMRIKLGLTIVAVIIFLTLFIFFVLSTLKENYTQSAVFGGVDGIFAIIILKVYNHFFK